MSFMEHPQPDACRALMPTPENPPPGPPSRPIVCHMPKGHDETDGHAETRRPGPLTRRWHGDARPQVTVVDRPDNGQDEGRDGYVKVGQYWVPIEPLQLHYPLGRGCCGAPDSDTYHQRGLCWMEGVHPDSPGFASGRAGAEEQQRDTDEDCGHHSWTGLMALLDEHWPADIFPTREDDITRDAGARIVSLLRWVDRLGGPQPDGEAEYATARHAFGSPEYLAELDKLSAPPCPVYSHGTDGWHCSVEGPHDQHTNAAGDVTW